MAVGRVIALCESSSSLSSITIWREDRWRKKRAPQLYALAKWAYNEPTSLYYNGPDGIEEIPSKEGTRQGEPLAGPFFSVAFRSLLEDLARTFKGEALALGYQDDGYTAMLGDRKEEVLEVYERHR